MPSSDEERQDARAVQQLGGPPDRGPEKAPDVRSRDREGLGHARDELGALRLPAARLEELGIRDRLRHQAREPLQLRRLLLHEGPGLAHDHRNQTPDQARALDDGGDRPVSQAGPVKGQPGLDFRPGEQVREDDHGAGLGYELVELALWRGNEAPLQHVEPVSRAVPERARGRVVEAEDGVVDAHCTGRLVADDLEDALEVEPLRQAPGDTGQRLDSLPVAADDLLGARAG